MHIDMNRFWLGIELYAKCNQDWFDHWSCISFFFKSTTMLMLGDCKTIFKLGKYLCTTIPRLTWISIKWFPIAWFFWQTHLSYIKPCNGITWFYHAIECFCTRLKTCITWFSANISFILATKFMLGEGLLYVH